MSQEPTYIGIDVSKERMEALHHDGAYNGAFVLLPLRFRGEPC